MKKHNLTYNVLPDTNSRTRQLISKAFGRMTNHSRQMADDIAEFRRQREEVRKRINNGARKTSGRIV